MLSPEEKFISCFFELKRAQHNISMQGASSLAVILRLFLKDKFLHLANKMSGLNAKLTFPIDLTHDEISKDYIFLANYRLTIKPSPFETTINSVSFDKFLSFRILRIYDKSFTVSELVDIVANKIGNAHFNPAQAVNSGLNPFDERVNKAIVNSILRICQSVAVAGEKIADSIMPIDYSQSMGHWVIDDGLHKNLVVEGSQWMEVNLSKAPRTAGLTMFLACRFLPIRSDSVVATSMELSGGHRILFGFDWKGDTFLEFAFGKEVHRVDFETAEHWGAIGRLGVYCVQLEIVDECISGSFRFISQGRLELQEIFGAPVNIASFDCSRFVFGADHLGERGARMKVAELGLFGLSHGAAIEDLLRYLLAKYELA